MQALYSSKCYDQRRKAKQNLLCTHYVQNSCGAINRTVSAASIKTNDLNPCKHISTIQTIVKQLAMVPVDAGYYAGKGFKSPVPIFRPQPAVLCVSEECTLPVGPSLRAIAYAAPPGLSDAGR